MDGSRIDEIVKTGEIEIWNIRNEAPMYHPFHIHGVQFLILERNGKKPLAYETGWKDTVLLNPEESVRLIMKSPAYPDPTTAYMYHCHILEHEDMGMMGQFVVVSKDTKNEDIKAKNKLPNEYQSEMSDMRH